jgi:hypothetical protein
MLGALDDIAGAVALTALVVATLALLVSLAAWRRGGRDVTVTPEHLPDDPSMEQYVVAQADRLEALTSAVAGLREQAAAADSGLRHAVQHVGLVRFNPFEDTGGNQSFVLAMLDANADGIVLSSLHSRTATRVYVKAILGGRSEATLSAEEVAALRDAGLQI